MKTPEGFQEELRTDDTRGVSVHFAGNNRRGAYGLPADRSAYILRMSTDGFRPVHPNEAADMFRQVFGDTPTEVTTSRTATLAIRVR